METLELWLLARMHRSLDALRGSSWVCGCTICVRARVMIAKYLAFLDEQEEEDTEGYRHNNKSEYTN